MPTYNRERETEAAHALTHNQEVWSGQGWAVVTAGGLTAGSNALQLDVGSYEVLTGGTSTVSVGPTTIDAQLPDSDPYWLVVYVDGSGALQTAAGPEGAVAPGLGVDVREVSSPPPPTLAAVGPVTVLGRVLVTDDGITDARIDDRVFGGDRVFDAIDANTVETNLVNTGDLDADGSGRIGGDMKFGAELLRTRAPNDTTDVFDTVGALDPNDYSLVTVTSDSSRLSSGFSDRGFVGLFYLDLDGNGAIANLNEIATVAGYQSSHIASLDTSTGEITYGTGREIGQRADIVVSALRMG